MSTQGIRAGKAFVEFFIDDKRVNSGLAKISQNFKKFGSIGAAATAPIVAGLTACVAAAIKVGGEFADMAARTGASVESLSALAYAADQTGTSMATVEKAMRKAQVQIANADDSSGGFNQTLERLGLHLADLKGKRPEQQFVALADAIGKVQDPGERAALAIKVFGKAGAELIPMLTDAKGGVKGLMDAARAMGVVMTDEDAVACDELGDSLGDVKKQFLAMAVQIGVSVAGPLTEFLNWAKEILAETIAWIKENPNLVRTLAAVTVGVAACSAAAIAFGTVLTVITAHPIIAALAAIAAGVLAVKAAFWGASQDAKSFAAELEGTVKAKYGITAAAPAPNASATSSALVAQAAQAQLKLDSVVDGPDEDRAIKDSADSMGLIEKWTHQSATHLGRIVQLMQSNEGIAWGAG
jgi:TP901 family phage tail tape measure protein